MDATTGAVTPIITVASGLSFVEANASAFGSNHYFLYVKNEMYLDQLYSIDVSSNPVSMTPIGSPLSNAVHGTEFNCDTDGDGLCDDWETNGVTVNVNGTPVFVDLPAMGADPRHKDTFVHADYMVDAGLCVPLIGCFFGHTHKPKADAIQIVTRAFANAPVQNPDGSSGITLHVDCGPDCVMNPITGQTWGAMSQANGLNHQNALGFTVGGNYDG